MRAFLWHNRLLVALVFNAGLLSAVLLSIDSRQLELPHTAAAFAQSASPVIGSALPAVSPPLIVMPGQLAPNIYGCYLLDPSRDSLCVYEYFHSDGLKLVAARNIAYDRKLQNFNTSPAPSEVKALAQSAPAETEH